MAALHSARVKPQLKRLLVYAGWAAALGLGIAIWRVGIENLPQPSNTQTLTQGKAEGRRQQFASWEFTYDRAITLPDQVTQEIDGIHDGIYYKGGKPLVRMHADRVIMNSLTHDFTVQGPVHFSVDDKGKARVVDATFAKWNQTAQTLTIPGKVVVKSADAAQIELDGLSVNLQTGTYQLGKIRGGFTP